MVKVIGAETLHDALIYLGQWAVEAEERGERNVIFCEDRLTLLAERAVLTHTGGSFSTEVTTYARFLAGERATLTKQGSVAAIGAIIEEKQKELSCFRGAYAQPAYETIAQLSASRVSPEDLRRGAEEVEGLLKNKLNDLSLIYEEYRNFLAEKDLVDENGYLSLLPEKIQSELLGANVCFFAFPSFTAQAREGVRAAYLAARETTGIFVSGTEDLYTCDGERLFCSVLQEAGADIEKQQIKSTLLGEAEHLRRGIFSPESGREKPMETDKVFLSPYGDEEEELYAAAMRISAYLDKGYRYRDFGVLVAGEEGYLTAKKVFGDFSIPFFADRKRPLSEHPFLRLAADTLNAVWDGVLPVEADAILANPYFTGGDEYRNYLLKYGAYRGGYKRAIKQDDETRKRFDLKRVQIAHEKLIKLISLFPREGTGAAFCEGVRLLYKEAGGDVATKRLTERLSREEEGFLRACMGDGEREGMQETLLSEIERVAGERKFTARAFAELLGSGAEATTVSLIPQYADAVFVGDATQSKFARVKVLFLTGLTDVLPLTSADTAVIMDGEISRLSELQVEIEPAIATVNARARESLALNMCNFTEALYASYPLRVGGAESVKGEAYEYLTKLFAPVGREDDETLLLARCRTRTRAVLKLLSYKTDIEEGRSRDRRFYAALYAALKEEDRAYLDKVFSAGIKRNITCGEKLYFEWGSVSPTLLESYFGCPYAGFSERGLKLRRREERAVFDADAGIFVHKVLQIVAGKLNDFTGEEDCRSFAMATAERLLLTPAFASLTDTQSGKYTGERLVEESAKASVVSYRQLKASRFRVAGVEQKLTDPELLIGGQTDRIDETDKYVRIFDYKSGSTDSYDKPSNYYTGRKLQLELYLRTASGDKKPAGAFYFPAADSFSKTEEEKYRLIGFYNGEDEVVALHDSTLEEGEKSSFFEGTRGGKLTDKGMSGEDFERFLDYAALVSVKAEHEMKEGNVAPSPYKGVCLYCKYKGMCGYDGDPRREESVKCSDIVRIVKLATGEEE